MCYVGAEYGLGHLSRLLALAHELKFRNDVTPEFLVFGEYFEKNELVQFHVHRCSYEDDFCSSVNIIIENSNINLMVLDVTPKIDINDLEKHLKNWKKKKVSLVSIDSLVEYSNFLDLIWIPSFNFNYNNSNNLKSKIKSGWDSYLIQKKIKHNQWFHGKKLLVLTGGSDTTNLSETLPRQLDEKLDDKIEISWIKGPFSDEPALPKKCRLNWSVYKNLESLDDIIVQHNYAMTVFGVSFFEILQYGIPTVVFSPYNNKDDGELKMLAKENVAFVAASPKNAIDGIIKLMASEELSKSYSLNSRKKMRINGSKKLSEEIYSLLLLK